MKNVNNNTYVHASDSYSLVIFSIKYTNADVWLRNPDDGRKVCPKHVES